LSLFQRSCGLTGGQCHDDEGQNDQYRDFRSQFSVLPIIEQMYEIMVKAEFLPYQDNLSCKLLPGVQLVKIDPRRNYSLITVSAIPGETMDALIFTLVLN